MSRTKRVDVSLEIRCRRNGCVNRNLVVRIMFQMDDNFDILSTPTGSPYNIFIPHELDSLHTFISLTSWTILSLTRPDCAMPRASSNVDTTTALVCVMAVCSCSLVPSSVFRRRISHRCFQRYQRVNRSHELRNASISICLLFL